MYKFIRRIILRFPIYRLLKKSGYYAAELDLRKRFFVIPVIFSAAAALCDAASIGLMIPLIDGLIKGDFSAAGKTPILKNIIEVCPPGITSTYAGMLSLTIAVTFGMAFLNHFLRYATGCSTAFLIQRSANNLRKSVFSKYLEQGKTYFDRFSFGRLNSVLHGCTGSIAHNSVQITYDLTDILVAILYAVMLFLLNWRLTLLVVVLGWPATKLFNFLIAGIRRRTQELVKHTMAVQQRGFDVINNILLVKVNSTEETERRHYDRISDAIEKTKFDFEKINQLIRPFQRVVIMALFVLAVYLISVEARARGTIQIARILVYCGILRELSIKAMAFTGIRVAFARIIPPAREIAVVLGLDDRYEVKGGGQRFECFKTGIEIKDLAFGYYEGQKVLKGLNLIFNKGANTAIVGPTGAGKTTIISLLLRLYECPPGTIFVDGVDIREYSIKSLMAKIAVVSQEAQLFNETLRYNIQYGYEGVSRQRLFQAVDQARLSEFVEGLPQGLDTVIGDRGVRLSGGEKQRVAIARALLKDAPILILDEATSALDHRTEKLIHEAIDLAIKDRTAIMIAHRLSTIKEADKICVIEDGRLLEEGPLQDLLDRKGKFYEYCKAQNFD